jgi:hypothetical protein
LQDMPSKWDKLFFSQWSNVEGCTQRHMLVSYCMLSTILKLELNTNNS